jgi:VIT1/CCC1 family predicted Fe2+/Mn2+ transporter
MKGRPNRRSETPTPKRIPEKHFSTRTPWIRAAVLGADDGILSTSSIMIGVAAASTDTGTVLVAGIAGLVAGACSMAIGEYVSVSSQRDTELADLRRESSELEADPEGEKQELKQIYRSRGLSADLAGKVAEELSEGDRLVVHARDELGLDQSSLARPYQAAAASAASFIVGGALPLLAALLSAGSHTVWVVVAIGLISLAVLGGVGARLGGAPLGKGAVRVLIGGGAAMAISAGIGRLIGLSNL